MRSRRRTLTAPAADRHPRQIALVLLFVVTALIGAGSPVVSPPSGDVLSAARRSGYLGVVARRPGALTPAQVLRAAVRRDRLAAAERSRLDDVLAAASPAAQVYLAEAFAAGHTVPEIAAFAAVIAGHGPLWLRHRLRPIDPDATGPVEFHGSSIDQFDHTTCGSTSVVAARALVDPLYALDLTTQGRPGTAEESGDRFQRRLRVQEQRVHDETDLLWPQRAGTPPWGISRLLDHDLAGLGARYRWAPAVPAVPAQVDSVIRPALAAADLGYPVPVLIGDLIPRHYVLLLRHDAGGATFFEPTAGEIIRVSARDLARRDFGELGYRHLYGAILPAGSAD